MSANISRLHAASQQTVKISKTRKQTPPVTPELGYSLDLAGDDRYASDGQILYFWTGVYWQPVTIEDGDKKAWGWLAVNRADKASPSTASACHRAAILQCDDLPKPFTGDGVLIPCQNGYVAIGDGASTPSLITPSPKMGMTYVVACDYTPSAACPEFDDFIAEVLPVVDVRDYVQEFVGYTLLADTRFQKAQLWLGSGGNGKGTLAQIVSALHQCTMAASLDDLAGFKLAGLLGASLVYCDETPARIDEQRIKSLISGDLVQLEKKYRDPVSFRPTAKWIVSANAIPAISDQSDGFWRRWQIVPFPGKFEGVAKPLLAQTIIKDELSGVLNWALEGLIRLLQRGKFSVLPSAMSDAISGGKMGSNSVLAWWSDIDADITISAETTEKSLVYEHYAAWCRSNGMMPVNSEKFWVRLPGAAGQTLLFSRLTARGRRVRSVNIFVRGVDILP